MEASGKVAIGRFVMRNKQYAAAIRAEEGRLVMSSLAYADEVVDPADIDELQGLDHVEVTRKEMVMAESLVESLSADFEPDKYHDEYRDQVLALIDKKVAGEEFEAPAATAEKPNVIDIMAALEASVSAAKEARGRHPARKSDEQPAEPSGKAASKKSSAKRVTAAKPTKRAVGNGAVEKAAGKTLPRKTSPRKTAHGKASRAKKAPAKKSA
jgi:DNA end-binding protein Ku